MPKYSIIEVSFPVTGVNAVAAENKDGSWSIYVSQGLCKRAQKQAIRSVLKKVAAEA